MELVGKHRLVAHREHPPKLVRSVVVSVWSGEHAMLSYTIEGAGALVLPDHGFERLDGLWQRTCFELFMKPSGGSGYREFNFAPLGGWNAYAFSAWRQGMAPLELTEPPHLVDSRLDDRMRDFPECYALDVVLGRDVFACGGRQSLTAILEEEGGTRSYWALAHPPGEPDFHNDACFVIDLPPADGA